MAAKHGMSSADAAWLRMDSPTNLMIVNSVLWFEEPVDWKRLRKVFQERIVDVFPRFRQIAVEPLPPRRPFWQDCEDFELGVHLHHVRLPAPGDDRVLREFTSDVMSRPLDRTKPLWEMYLVDDYRGGSAVITRIHHAVADGIALARLMMLLTDPSPRGRHNGTHFAAREHSRLDALLSLPGQVVHEVTHALPADVRALAKTLLALPDASTRLRGPLVAQNRVAWSRELSLARIKRIGKRYDATVNDVLVAAVAGAIARYLKDNGDELKRIHAMVPFNLRPLDEPVDPKLGNEFALVRLTLPIDERTPRKRLLATKHEMDAI